MNTKEEKKALRAEYRRLRVEISEERKKALDEKICREIISLACFRFADTLLTYYPIKGEIDLTPVTLEALARGKRVAYPVCDTESREMTFRYINSLSELCEGSYSIPEPPQSAPEFDGGEGSLCIVPAFAFDKDGYRLGYGGGYYDRFLKSFGGTSLGAVYSDFLTDELPRGYYDIAARVIVTERGSIITNAGKEKKRK
ncbi:MAG: 5-formyltetrahydrofolate cyclo-ligase [Clostridia bacterium]|nr:5-formyltetrahydrofolate cyclo-ligase [Clostridia bacterium]